jgi:hypothetical protein
MSNSNENCFDILSPQRLSLLNLVQVARLHLDKMLFYPKTSISLLIEQSNRPELQQPHSALSSKTSKPPIGKSNKSTAANVADPNQLFFIEYQFPVLANTRDSMSGLTMATQAMRVVSKRCAKNLRTKIIQFTLFINNYRLFYFISIKKIRYDIFILLY